MKDPIIFSLNCNMVESEVDGICSVLFQKKTNAMFKGCDK